MRQLVEPTATDILEWALRAYRGRIALACSFGSPSGLTALDMALRIDPGVPVYYLDTDLLFPQTYALVDRISKRYGIHPIAVAPSLTLGEQAECFGDMLWTRDPDRCCALRKVEPQQRFLQSYDAWISGARRDQTENRAALEPVSRDLRTGTVKICPLAGWSAAEVAAYVREHDIPTNALHDDGYPSIGCIPCTHRVAEGEDPRSGRWPGFGKTECGLHL